MKTLLLSIALLAASTTLTIAQTTKHHSWMLTITPNSTKASLDSVATAWEKDSITLKFSTLKFNSKGKLSKVKGSVDYTVKGNNVNGTFDNDSHPTVEIKLTDKPSIHIQGK